jgi:two-component system cell cycle response regulator DivK
MRLSDWTVVIVEDEGDSMEFVQGLLEYHGISSIAAPTAEEALAILEKTVPTLIIIDLALPCIDGWRLLAWIRQNKALLNVPCIAITAYHTLEIARKAIEAGFDAYFAKPLDATSFVQELTGIVGSSPSGLTIRIGEDAQHPRPGL